MPSNTSDIDRLRRLYVDARMTISQVAASLGVAPQSTVYARLDRLGFARRSARPRQDARPRDDDLRELYATERLSLRQIAEQFGVSAQAVHGWVTAAGIERRPPGATAPAIDADELVEQYLGGRNGLELAQRYQCSPATIYRRLEDAGVDRRQPALAVDRGTLVGALAEWRTAPDIAAQLETSITAVCRALKREHLETAAQASRQRSAEHLAEVLDSLGRARADR